MTKTLTKNTDYAHFLHAIKARIRTAKISASRAVYKELIDLYWSIGKDIVEKQELLGWGKSVVERLSKDLKKTFPGTRGYSTQNLWWMRQFYMEYHRDINLLQLARDLPWFSNVTIFSKVKDDSARAYYLRATAEMGWSRNVLLNQIKANAYERHRLNTKQHNFEKALRGIQKPIGVAEYRLTTKLPKSLAGKIPDAKTLKKEILKELND